MAQMPRLPSSFWKRRGHHKGLGTCPKTSLKTMPGSRSRVTEG